MDSHVSSLVDKHVAGHISNGHHEADEADPDSLFAELEEEDDSAFRAARAQQLSEELKKYKPTNNATLERKIVMTLRSDDEVLKFTTENERAVLHFLHPEFARCATMDRHLEGISEAQAVFATDAEGVSWGRVDAREAPFVCAKMEVKVLPAVVGFKDGVAVGRVVGFEGLIWGGREDSMEVMRLLEEKLVEWKVLGRAVIRGIGAKDDESESDQEETSKGVRRGITGRKQKVEDEDDDWD